jgi:hypothetical protein
MMPTNTTTSGLIWGKRAIAQVAGRTVVVALLMVGVLASPSQAAPSTFTVTNTNDSGAGSLRQAILDANANNNPGEQDHINFNIPGTGVHTIAPASAAELPSINEPVIINGYSQPDSSVNTLPKATNAELMIELDGTSAGDFANGLTIQAKNSVVKGLVINGFSSGIVVKEGSSASKIEGNFIGTDPSGTIDEGNFNGVWLFYRSNTTTVGGTSPANRNLISGSDYNGVDIFVSDGNKVLGNLIGTNKGGVGALGNGNSGIDAYNASDNFVGNGSSGGANTIAFNGFDNGGSGVEIATPSDHPNRSNGNRILRNSIFSNQRLGIDLDRDGRTLNDAGDHDVGANHLQNFPVVSSAKTGGGTTTIKGKLSSSPVAGLRYTIEFFSNPSGTKEGMKFIGQKIVETDSSGHASFTFSPSSKVAVGRAITATATRNSTHDTSEFSTPRTVVS